MAGQRHEHDALRGPHRVAVRHLRRGEEGDENIHRDARRRVASLHGVHARRAGDHDGDEPGGHGQDAAVHGRGRGGRWCGSD